MLRGPTASNLDPGGDAWEASAGARQAAAPRRAPATRSDPGPARRGSPPRASRAAHGLGIPWMRDISVRSGLVAGDRLCALDVEVGLLVVCRVRIVVDAAGLDRIVRREPVRV